ncbi:N-acetylmuramoyl-L-alanine amidase CwlD [Natronincola ferrireducens]|uniref:N-acetylmuramoyl-L-alanine amidase n=1 Tax=Natronincola ferrireducens TaxID=393762 RepID=A0A1G9I881_9FIRM|nr:N-acetylmuramoyl-L-alanine amidase CwlD [Natronincola ferrireducens]SDL21438.1 N-acetylmuramoyl-L-alanine amidase [Natronincola ferrireducens]
MKIIVIKKKWIILTVTISIIVGGCLGIWQYYNSRVAATFLPSLTKVIVLDPGHGGVDPGAVSKNGVVEKDINLAIALHLKGFLEQSGAIVIMTRTEDKGLYSSGGSIRQKKNEDLRNRKEIVENSNADIFITIHLNAFSQTQYYGAQTFYPKGNAEGKKLAVKVQEELINTLDKNNKRVALEKEGIYIIKGLDIPTVLVECGFLSNPQEEKLLQKASYQKKIAWAIYIGIQRYFSEGP